MNGMAALVDTSYISNSLNTQTGEDLLCPQSMSPAGGWVV